MTRDELIAALEAATAGTAELDAAIYLLCEVQIPRREQEQWDAPIPLLQYALNSVQWHGFQFTRDLAAAKRIVPTHERGGWFWRVGHGSEKPGWAHLNKFHPSHCDREDEVTAWAATPEIALCIASLKALTPTINTREGENG